MPNFEGKNGFGLGTKISVFVEGVMQYRELYTTRGFQSSVDPVLHFGLGQSSAIDSLLVEWPNGRRQSMHDVSINETLMLDYEQSLTQMNKKMTSGIAAKFSKVEGKLGLDFVHEENDYLDFEWKRFMPYQITDRGGKATIGDLNGDGKDDVFFTNSGYASPQIFIQQNGEFVAQETEVFEGQSEVLDASIADLNNDGKNDVLLAAGGEGYASVRGALIDYIYLNRGDDFEKTVLFDQEINSSVIRLCDYDNDGDLDAFVGGYLKFLDFSDPYPSTLLENNDGTFVKVELPFLETIGGVTDAVWSDFDQDGDQDLVLVGEWMSPTFIKNNDGKLELSPVSLTSSKLNGLWQSIIPFDIDQDGDLDYLLGNWGLNNRFSASENAPLKLYVGSFTPYGMPESILASKRGDEYYPVLGLDVLSDQLVFLKKKFTTFQSFAGKPVEEVFDAKQLAKCKLLEVHTLHSGYLKNNKGQFSFHVFDDELQVAPIMCFTTIDDEKGQSSVLAAGNYFGVTPYHGRFDGFSGAMIRNENDIILGHEMGLNLTQKSARSFNTITIENKQYLLISYNNQSNEVYEILP